MNPYGTFSRNSSSQLYAQPSWAYHKIALNRLISGLSGTIQPHMSKFHLNPDIKPYLIQCMVKPSPEFLLLQYEESSALLLYQHDQDWPRIQWPQSAFVLLDANLDSVSIDLFVQSIALSNGQL